MRPVARFIAAALPALAATPATADLACRFDTECLEGEACIESGFRLTVETGIAPGTLFAEGGYPIGDRIVTDAETVEVVWRAREPWLAAFGASASGFHLLTFDATGAARYTAHLPGAGLSMLYVGACE
ncbi:MAG: hypothetical protein QNJ13_09840 [Paracoccaceae bacterium]|nr:hypothetical protein [Paracoccaceae bacterium]